MKNSNEAKKQKLWFIGWECLFKIEGEIGYLWHLLRSCKQWLKETTFKYPHPIKNHTMLAFVVCNIFLFCFGTNKENEPEILLQSFLCCRNKTNFLNKFLEIVMPRKTRNWEKVTFWLQPNQMVLLKNTCSNWMG